MMALLDTWWGNIILILLAFILLAGISMLPGAFIRILGRVVLNCFWGAVILAAVNFLAVWTSVALPLNGVTLAVAGVLGGPGVLALAVISALPI